jgi:PadR family transcriptional regulator PadR
LVVESLLCKVEHRPRTRVAARGHQIAKHIQQSTEDVLQVEHGFLYPALHRLKERGWLAGREHDLDREIRSHLDLEAEEAGQPGLSSDEARYAA